MKALVPVLEVGGGGVFFAAEVSTELHAMNSLKRSVCFDVSSEKDGIIR